MKIKLLIGVLLLSIGSFAQRKNDGWAIQSHYGIMEGKGQMSNYASTASIGQIKIILIDKVIMNHQITFY